MEKTAKVPWEKILGYGLGGTAVAGAGAAGGGVLGYKMGAKRTANQMTSAFIEANNRENQQIADAFKSFNRAENRAIANAYMRRGFQSGVQHATRTGTEMKKKAALEEIYNDAFNDEYEKLAVSMSSIGSAIKGAAGKYKESWKNLIGGTKDIIKQRKAMKGMTGSAKKQQQQWTKELVRDTAKKSRAALGTIAGGGTLAAAGGGYAALKD